MGRSADPAIPLRPPSSATSRPLPALPPRAVRARRFRPPMPPKRPSALPWPGDSSRTFNSSEADACGKRLRGLNMRVISNAVAVCLGLGLLCGLAAGVARADNDTGAGDHPNLFALGLYHVDFHVHADD